MEVLLLLILAGWLGYSFLNANTKRGIETVRAYLYLGNLVAGATKEQANAASLVDVGNGPTEVIRDSIACVREDYAGSQTAMIADAYSKGMRSRLPTWYRAITFPAPSIRSDAS